MSKSFEVIDTADVALHEVEETHGSAQIRIMICLGLSLIGLFKSHLQASSLIIELILVH